MHTVRMSDRNVAIGSRSITFITESAGIPSGTYSVACSDAYSMFVMEVSTTLHAKFTMCGKHLGANFSVANEEKLNDSQYLTWFSLYENAMF